MEQEKLHKLLEAAKVATGQELPESFHVIQDCTKGVQALVCHEVPEADQGAGERKISEDPCFLVAVVEGVLSDHSNIIREEYKLDEAALRTLLVALIFDRNPDHNFSKEELERIQKFCIEIGQTHLKPEEWGTDVFANAWSPFFNWRLEVLLNKEN